MKRVLLLLLGVLLAGWLDSSTAIALEPSGELRAEERAELERGEVVQRAIRFERDGARYVGGIVYVVVDAPPGAVMASLLDVHSYTDYFPMTLEAKRLGARGREMWVYLKHGNRLGEAQYTLRARRDGLYTVRFWLDDAYDHDVDDLFGFWRVTKLSPQRSLLTYAAVLDLGDGLLRSLFEERIRKRALTTPGKVRDHVEKKWRRSQTRLSRASFPSP